MKNFRGIGWLKKGGFLGVLLFFGKNIIGALAFSFVFFMLSLLFKFSLFYIIGYLGLLYLLFAGLSSVTNIILVYRGIEEIKMDDDKIVLKKPGGEKTVEWENIKKIRKSRTRRNKYEKYFEVLSFLNKKGKTLMLVDELSLLDYPAFKKEINKIAKRRRIDLVET